MGGFRDGLGSNIVAQYSAGPIISLHGRITINEYVNMDKLGNQVHPMIQMSFPNNAPLHTSGSVQPWFEMHEGELQHLP
jgi:aromatic ring-cleaving dioxygenase